MKNILNKLKKKILNNNGYVELIATITVFFFLISILIWLSPPFITREKMNNITRRTIDKVEFDGKITADTYQFVDDLLEKANLKSKNPTYRFTGDIRPNGKIQLRDKFTFELNVYEKIKITGFGVGDIDMPIKKSQEGISEVFYKSSEL